jgi:hypothetical protein
LRDRHRERRRVVRAKELSVHSFEHDPAVPRLVRELDGRARAKVSRQFRGQVDRPVGVVAHVGRIDESAAACEDQTVALLAHELALAPERVTTPLS